MQPAVSDPSDAKREPQSVSPLAPIGVEAAIHAASDPSVIPRPKIFDEFALTDRVAVVSGGGGTLGLEMALVLCEAGARAVYCFDLPGEPSEDWRKTQDYVSKLGNGSRLEYVSVDVTKQSDLWERCQEIGDKEGQYALFFTTRCIHHLVKGGWTVVSLQQAFLDSTMMAWIILPTSSNSSLL